VAIGVSPLWLTASARPVKTGRTNDFYQADVETVHPDVAVRVQEFLCAALERGADSLIGLGTEEGADGHRGALKTVKAVIFLLCLMSPFSLSRAHFAMNTVG